MLQFYLYDTATGKVLARAFYDESGDGAAARSIAMGLINPATEYAPGGVKTARPQFNPATVLLDKSVIVANGSDAATVSGIPSGTVVKVFKDQDKFPRAVATVTDGTAVLRVDAAGSYLIVLSNFPTQDATFTVTAT